jgi:hypothetical protein
MSWRDGSVYEGRLPLPVLLQVQAMGRIGAKTHTRFRLFTRSGRVLLVIGSGAARVRRRGHEDSRSGDAPSKSASWYSSVVIVIIATIIISA